MEIGPGHLETEAPPTPPPTPPCIKFCPPLYLQRRSTVHQLLRNYSTKTQAIHSLLDVGCGIDMELLTSLIPCDDKLPLSVLTGLDLDKETWTVGEKNLHAREDYSARWRELTVSLLFGSFARISAGSLGRYDAITACEVVEHLDPGPLASFLPVLLGRMKPNILIVTTPNRDFNRLFEMPISPIRDKINQAVYDPVTDPQMACRRHYRAPHEYAMRHHDHRFEFTRQEFKNWANKGAKRFGYSVRFFGCGNLEEGAYFQGNDWLITEAVERELKLGSMRNPAKSFEGAIKEAFGDCTQIAAFVRLNETKDDVHYDRYLKLPCQPSKMPNLHLNGLQFVTQRYFAEEDSSLQWPPDLRDLAHLFEDPMKYTLPTSAIEAWKADWSNVLEGANPEANSQKVVIHTNSKYIWDNSDRLQSRCRYHYRVFLKAILTAGQCIEQNNHGNPTSTIRRGYEFLDTSLGTGTLEVVVSLARHEDSKSWEDCAIKYNLLKTWDLDQSSSEYHNPSSDGDTNTDVDVTSHGGDGNGDHRQVTSDEDENTLVKDGEIVESDVGETHSYDGQQSSARHNSLLKTSDHDDAQLKLINVDGNPQKIVANSITRRSSWSSESEDSFICKISEMVKWCPPIPDPMDELKSQISWSLDLDNSLTPSHFPNDQDVLPPRNSTVHYSTKARFNKNPFYDLNENYVLPMTVVFWKPQLSDEYLWHWRIEHGAKMERQRENTKVASEVSPSWDRDDEGDTPKVLGDDGWHA